jgi:hypothetical protein
MPSAKKRVGRPPTQRTNEEKRAAKNASSLKSYHKRRQQPQQVSGPETFRIQIDPRSFLEQAGPQGSESGQVMASDRRILEERLNAPANELSAPADEQREQQQLLEVAIYL